MKTYLVGGAVRDALLGRPCTERDYVVVGAQPDDLLALGYRPVGKDFPVFLHPQSGDQYALARTERKTGAGYYGFATRFSPDVTLEEDLARRDLTINAMARSIEGGGATSSIRTVAAVTSRLVSCVTSRPLSSKTRCACCVSRVSLRASRRSASRSRPRRCS